MLDPKTIQEIANATGKTADLVKATGGFLDDLFGKTLREAGGIFTDWARYFKFRNCLIIAEKTQRDLAARDVKATLRAIPPRFTLPLLEAISLETEDDIQNLWAALLANAVDPGRSFCLRKVFLEVLRGLEPLDVQVLRFLGDPKLNERYTVLTGATVNVEVISKALQADDLEIKISLQTLALPVRDRCVGRDLARIRWWICWLSRG